MHTTSLRKVGGSTMLVIPPALLDLLQMKSGTKVGLQVDRGRLVVEPKVRPRYTLEQLLASCDASAPMTQEDQQWDVMKSTGGELR